jgi:hypothetical protein
MCATPTDAGLQPGAADPAQTIGGIRRHWRRLAVVTAVLVGALLVAYRLERPAPPPPAPPQGQILYVDTEGWYRRTPDEVAVRSPFALTLNGLPAGLPFAFGAWRGTDRPHDPAVDLWLRQPEVAVERTYRRPDGSLVWLSAFGSRGDKSYLLFEHTPESCYPMSGWAVKQFQVERLPFGPRPLPVNYGLAQNGSQQLVFAHLYVWDSAGRDPERGVVSLRLAAPVRDTAEATLAMLSRDFLAQLFPNTLAWHRF